MEDIEVKEIKTKQVIHKFYCDDCKDFLGESEECDDGYYERFGEFEISLPITNRVYQEYKLSNLGWYTLNKHLCPACAQKGINQIVEEITKLGFKKD